MSSCQRKSLLSQLISYKMLSWCERKKVGYIVGLAKTWSRKRRVIVKAERTAKGSNYTTSLPISKAIHCNAYG